MSDFTFRFKTIGPIKDAEIKLEGFTIITGGNNTGKTYLTHSVWAYLSTVRRGIPLRRYVQGFTEGSHAESILSTAVEELELEGQATLQIDDFNSEIEQWFDRLSTTLSVEIAKVFGADGQLFAGTRLSVDVSNIDYRDLDGYRRAARLDHDEPVLLGWFEPARRALHFETLEGFNEEESERVARRRVERWMQAMLYSVVARSAIRGVFISSAERTGAVVFQKELDFQRSKMLEEMIADDDGMDTLKTLRDSGMNHPQAVTANVDFIRSLPEIGTRPSQIVTANPQIEALLEEIVGGQYRSSDNQLNYVMKNVVLPVRTSSSTVRSLVDLWYFIMYVAEPGYVLIIDEPELNLHPRNQRLLARLLALVHKAGLQVLITTHSDYMVREISTLIALDALSDSVPPEVRQILDTQDVTRSMALDPGVVHVYTTSVMESTGEVSLTELEVTASGIASTSFDDVIDSQNELADMVGWAADEES